MTAAASSPRLLIVGVTGRALAASAFRWGRAVVVLDLFADRDTRELATECREVSAPVALRFHQGRLLAAARAFAPDAPLVYGSGFEGQIELLTRLAHGRELLGNPPAVVAAVRDPRQFFPLLDRLDIPHPDIRFEIPRPAPGWLTKRAGGAGGTHVRPAAAGVLAAGSYCQRFESGRPASVLFLADGRRAHVVGFNEQWVAPGAGSRPFLFGGAVSRLTLPAPLVRTIRTGLDALVDQLGLVGLNGMDFLYRDGEWRVLELNPRPPATLELYDEDYPGGLLRHHVAAVQGALPQAPASPGPARALGVVHASAGLVVTPDIRFPSWCRDVPMVGTRLATGHPICTVHAAAPDPGAARRLVERRRDRLDSRLTGVELGALA